MISSNVRFESPVDDAFTLTTPSASPSPSLSKNTQFVLVIDTISAYTIPLERTLLAASNNAVVFVSGIAEVFASWYKKLLPAPFGRLVNESLSVPTTKPITVSPVVASDSISFLSSIWIVSLPALSDIVILSAPFPPIIVSFPTCLEVILISSALVLPLIVTADVPDAV